MKEHLTFGDLEDHVSLAKHNQMSATEHLLLPYSKKNGESFYKIRKG